MDGSKTLIASAALAAVLGVLGVGYAETAVPAVDPGLADDAPASASPADVGARQEPLVTAPR